MKNLIDYTNGGLENIKAFASTHPAGDTFMRCLESLNDRCDHGENRKCVIGTDFAPYSLSFAYGEMTTDPEPTWIGRPINGGLIYHGPHDGHGSGQAPSFSVTMDKADGWVLHT
jgi:hypothetical protein